MISNRKILLKSAGMMFFLSALAAFFSVNAAAKQKKEMLETLNRVQKDMPEFSFTGRNFSEDELEYFSYYRLNFPKCTHYFGKKFISGYTIAVHAFVPENPSGTMFLIHGYYDHTGVMQGLISHYLDQNYSVVIYDHPGHGISSGDRNSINTFSAYTDVMEKIVDISEKKLKGPYSVTAHSMGCAITSDYLDRKRKASFENIVFIAPLFHIAHWDNILKVNSINSGIIDRSPRILRNNTKNREFRKFVSQDPLQSRILSSQWVKALINWNLKIGKSAVLDRKITVIQGTKDTTVDWKYNIAKIREIYPEPEIHYIKGAGHQLMNEIPSYRNEMYEIINEKTEN
ncbi:MAG: alpha/beta hydrolase [Spirochaetes bacterium]|nr:alpha/beta hydrolase [Spirochaetota bacterium]